MHVPREGFIDHPMDWGCKRSQSPRLVCVGRDLKAHPAPTSATGRDTFH